MRKKTDNYITACISACVCIYVFITLICRQCLLSSCLKGRRVIVYYSQVAWDDVWQRPQELSLYLKQKRTVIYVAPVQYHHIIRTMKHDWRAVRVVGDNNSGIAFILSPVLISGHYKSKAIYAINCFFVSLIVRWTCRKIGEIDVLTDTPFSFSVIKRLLSTQKTNALHYDVIDDFTAFDWSPSWSVQLDHELTSMAKSLTTGTLFLQRERQRMREDVVDFIAVGVNGKIFSDACASQAYLKDQSGTTRKIIGYIGSITDRIDLTLILALAESCPDALLVMIGPIRVSDLPVRENILWLGSRRHEELPAIVKSFDIAIIPFIVNSATVKLFPVKTMEYMAAKIPIVSTDLPDIVEYFRDYVHVVANKNEFCKAVSFYLSHKTDDAKLLSAQCFALSHTWEQMGLKLSQSMKDLEL